MHEWILLIHQLPGQPSKARVRIWRKLQRLGAVAVKNAAYVLPLTETTREDFGWLSQEIIDLGGEASLFVAEAIDTAADGEIAELFRAARDKDYDAWIAEAEVLLETIEEDARQGHLSPGTLGKRATAARQLQSRLDEISRIDFLGAENARRATATMTKLHDLLQEHEHQSSASDTEETPSPMDPGELRDRTWVTRKRLHIDRLACAWLIVRFVDADARFRFIANERTHKPRKNEVCFDMYGAELSHHGEDCSFETFLKRLDLTQDRVLVEIAEIVHDIDLKDGKFGRDEGQGIDSIVRGLAKQHADDEALREAGVGLFDALYAQLEETN